MKKILKKISILLAVLAFAMLFKCSEATKVGEASDKIMADIYTLDSGKEAIVISPNSGFKAFDGKLYKSDLDKFCNENNIQITSIKDKEIGESLATGDILVDNNNTERVLILCGDIEEDGAICDAFDVDIIINDYLQKIDVTETQKIAANLYDADNRLNVFDIKRLRDKFLNYDSLLGNTLVYTWGMRNKT